MGIPHYLAVLRRRRGTVAGGLLVGLLIAAAFAFLPAPSFRATSSIYLSVDPGSDAGALARGQAYLESQVRDFSSLADLPVVLDPVIDELDLHQTPEQLADAVAVASPLDTRVVRITVRQPEARQAALVATAVARQLAVTVQQLAPRGLKGTPAALATVGEAAPPARPFSPYRRLDLVVGGGLGLAVGSLGALQLDALEARRRGRSSTPSQRVELSRRA